MTDATPEAPDALRRSVLEIEAHVSEQGWDLPESLFALVETARLVAEEPTLAEQLGIDTAVAESLTPVEQEVPAGEPLEGVLQSIAWPESVFGCVAVMERIVLPPEADEAMPEDPEEAQEYAAAHPSREEVRMVAGVTRDGRSYCAMRLRSHDEDTSVIEGPDLVPGLIELVRGTLAG